MRATPLTRRTAALVLAWFVLFITVAGIAPLVQAQSFDSICTSAGEANSDAHGGGESGSQAGHTLKCFLCTGLSAPPCATAQLPPSASPLGHALLPLVSAHLAALTGAPLPARGPPLFS